MVESKVINLFALKDELRRRKNVT